MGEVQTSQRERAAYLVVRAGRVRCALRAASVRRLVPSMRLAPVAGGGQHVAGLAEFGGEPLLVIDLLAVLEAGESSSRSLVVVVDTGAGARRETFGLAVDEALEVTAIDSATIQTVADGPVVGQATISGLDVRVVDVAALGNAHDLSLRDPAAPIEGKTHSGDEDDS